MSDIRSLDLAATNKAIHVFASVKEWEAIAEANASITINGGVAMAIFCESAGSVIEITNSVTTSSKVTPVLPAGFFPIEVMTTVAAGTVLVGNVWAVSW
jgi:hypothetical protein